MAISISPNAQRVLGVLIEKSLAQPAYYPMTLNAVTAASNQKTNRDPVLSLTDGEVGAALHELREYQLVNVAEPERGSRSNRFRHEVENRFGWNAAARAIMAELLLRGPQTPGELRGRASRMTHLSAIDYVMELLGELQRSDPPFVVELPREPGRRESRFAHLLGGEVHAPPAPAVPVPREVAAPAGPVAAGSVESATAEELLRRIERLEQRVRELEARLGPADVDGGA